MRQLTGFTLKPAAVAKAMATPTEQGRQQGLQKAFGVAAAPRPLLAASDATGEEILASYSDGSAAVALRRTNTGASLFVGTPGLTSELLRAAARVGGVHLFTDTDCNVYANGRFVALHASQDGPLQIDVGSRGPVTDVLTKTVVGEGPRFMLPIRRGETRIFGY